MAFENDEENVLKRKIKEQKIFDTLMIKEIGISAIIMSVRVWEKLHPGWKRDIC